MGTKEICFPAPAPQIYCPHDTFTCGSPASWDFLVPENTLAIGAKPNFNMVGNISGTTFDTYNGVIAGIPTTPTCTATNMTGTMTDSGGSASCTFGLTVKPLPPVIEYEKETFEFTHRTNIGRLSANKGSNCAPITNCAVKPALPE